MLLRFAKPCVPKCILSKAISFDEFSVQDFVTFPPAHRLQEAVRENDRKTGVNMEDSAPCLCTTEVKICEKSAPVQSSSPRTSTSKFTNSWKREGNELTKTLVAEEDG